MHEYTENVNFHLLRVKRLLPVVYWNGLTDFQGANTALCAVKPTARRECSLCGP
jgi:hypothetical protein